MSLDDLYRSDEDSNDSEESREWNRGCIVCRGSGELDAPEFQVAASFIAHRLCQVIAVSGSPPVLARDPDYLTAYNMPDVATPYSLCSLRFKPTLDDKHIFTMIGDLLKESFRNITEELIVGMSFDSNSLSLIEKDDAKYQLTSMINTLDEQNQNMGAINQGDMTGWGTIYKAFFGDPLRLESQCMYAIEKNKELVRKLPPHLQDKLEVTYWHAHDDYLWSEMRYGPDDTNNYMDNEAMFMIDRDENLAIGFVYCLPDTD